jgi:hypothetical protein
MKRRDWLLLFAACRGAPDGLDPIRFQKGLFLFSQRARVPARSEYALKPYAYGPMSAGIYDDLDRLVDEKLLERVRNIDVMGTVQKSGVQRMEEADMRGLDDTGNPWESRCVELLLGATPPPSATATPDRGVGPPG